jgi:hypothetical protein
VSEQDALLATKLHVPRPQPGFVPRPRLVEALGEGLARGLVVVCAPAGFGKTALLADWAESARRAVAWLSLDTADNDPARFWRHVVAALDRACPGIAERAGPLLGPPPSSFDGLVTALINELDAQPGADQVLLVLDDYHLIDAQPVHAALTFLLDHLPVGLRLVLTSRSDPPLPLARLRARGQLAELRAGELRFTPDEAAALLREATGPGLPGAAAAALNTRTEGWAAGLQLAALSLRGQPDPAGFVATFSGSHRYILDYLTGEVLQHQPEPVRTFLLETSVLERLSGPLCDAVTGRTDGQVMLEAIERAGLFLVPLDEVRGWWRYHHLFADLLRARLQQQQQQRVTELHRAAAAWSQEHGLADDAVRHALGAGDPVWAARLIERHFDGIFLQGESVTVQRWLSGLPPSWSGPVPGCAWRRRGWRWWVATWTRPGRHWMTPRARLRAPRMGRSSRRPAGRPACWRTSPRRSRSITPSSLTCAAMPRVRPGSRRRPWPNLARASGCWACGFGRCGPWRSGCAAGSPTPSAASPPSSPDGGRPVSVPWPRRPAISSARSSALKAAWTRRSAPISRRWRSPRRRARQRCPQPASDMWAWPRWPTSAASLMLPCAT